MTRTPAPDRKPKERSSAALTRQWHEFAAVLRKRGIIWGQKKESGK